VSWLGLWWVWIAVAVAFGALEIVLPVSVFLGFSAGAMLTGLLLLAGFDPGIGWTVLIFALASAAAYAGLRLTLRSGRGGARIVTRDVNDNPPPRP
jgi:membrane protein implicated in regulation of membrane protease activity